MAGDKMGFMDIFRVLSLLIVTVFVAFFVAPVAPWVLWIAIFANIYVISLELLKFYLGIKQMRSGKKRNQIIILSG